MIQQRDIEFRVTHSAICMLQFTMEQLQISTDLGPDQLTPVLKTFVEQGYLQQTPTGYSLSGDAEKRVAFSRHLESFYQPVPPAY